MSRKPIVNHLGKRETLGQHIVKNWQLYAMLLIPVIYYIIFRYVPMAGNVIAFRKYSAGGDIFGSGDWTLRFFDFFGKRRFKLTLANTLRINIKYLLVRFPATLIFALLLNEIRNLRAKKLVQTVSYLPHFISTVIVVGMVKELLSTSGPINAWIASSGGTKVSFVMAPEWFDTIFVGSGIWQALGWGTILYLAAISNINPTLYEAAEIDGASHFQRVLHVTIPCIMPTITTLLILDIGGLVGSGGAFEKVQLLLNGNIKDTADILSTYVYDLGIGSKNPSYSMATAIGLFEGLVNLILLTIANFVSRKTAGSSLW